MALTVASSSTSASCCIHCCSAIGDSELGLCKRKEDAESGLDVCMNTINRSQTAIRLLDQALYMVSEFEDIKTSHDKWFDRAMYKLNSMSTWSMHLGRSTQTHIFRQLGNAMHTDDKSLHNVRRRMSTLKFDHEKQSLHNVRRMMSTLILDHAMFTSVLQDIRVTQTSCLSWNTSEFICTLKTLYTLSHDSAV